VLVSKFSFNADKALYKNYVTSIYKFRGSKLTTFLIRLGSSFSDASCFFVLKTMNNEVPHIGIDMTAPLVHYYNIYVEKTFRLATESKELVSLKLN